MVNDMLAWLGTMGCLDVQRNRNCVIGVPASSRLPNSGSSNTMEPDGNIIGLIQGDSSLGAEGLESEGILGSRYA